MAPGWVGYLVELLFVQSAEAKPFQSLGRDKCHGVSPMPKDPLLTDVMYCYFK